MHLLCYEIEKSPEEIFVNANIVMICDDCLTNLKEIPSPKRKNSAANLIQSTINLQNPLLLSKTAPLATPPKSVKQSQQMQSVMESLVQKVDIQTATIVGLQASVDSMNDTLSQHKTIVGESVRMNNENMSSIKKTLSETPRFNQSARKQTYANALKQPMNGNTTPLSSKSTQPQRTSKPTVTGTSNNVIGKEPSPVTIRRNVRYNAPKPEKAIWISKLHRDTTEEELTSYIKDTIGITSTDQYQVRKLVKKDRELASYSFVSFRVTCPANMFDTLIDAKNWPTYCQIREFDMQQKTSSGVRLNQQSPKGTEGSPAKNEVVPPNATQEQQGESITMETS